jgi:hypothetical protein
MRIERRAVSVFALSILTAFTFTACGGASAAANDGAGQPGRSTRATGTYIPANNASTVEGVDSANRGYRDDVEQLIEDKYSSVPGVKGGAQGVARTYQLSIAASTLAMTDTSSIIQAGAQAGWCAAQNATAAHVQEMSAAAHAVYVRTFNTDARMAARQLFLSKAQGVGALNVDPAACGGKPVTRVQRIKKVASGMGILCYLLDAFIAAAQAVTR